MKIAQFALALALGLTGAAALAGRPCESSKGLSDESFRKGLDMALQTAQALEASGQEVVLLARAGQDLSKYKVTYSHLGFAYREKQPDGTFAWRVLHKLNHCGKATSDIFKQGLGEFFMDNPWRYEAAWIAMEVSQQDALKATFLDPKRATRLHQRAYNMVAYPWSLKYQQSNQWALETLIANGLDGSGDEIRQKAQNVLRGLGYKPAVLTIDPLTRLGARMSAANIAFDDHPDEERYANRIETITADSVFDWLRSFPALSAGTLQTVTWKPESPATLQTTTPAKPAAAAPNADLSLVRMAIRVNGSDFMMARYASKREDTGGNSPEERKQRAKNKMTVKGYLDMFSALVLPQMSAPELEQLRVFFASPLGLRYRQIVIPTLTEVSLSVIDELKDRLSAERQSHPANNFDAWSQVNKSIDARLDQAMKKFDKDPENIVKTYEAFAY